MSEYIKHTWENGEVIDAPKLNNIETGIAEAKKEAEKVTMATETANKAEKAAQNAQNTANEAKTAAGNAATAAGNAATAAQNAQNTANGKEAAGTAAGLINRTTKVNASDTNYTTLMARGTSLNSADTTPTVNGAIYWTYK